MIAADTLTAEERLAALEERAEAARERGHPGPTERDLDVARKAAEKERRRQR